MDVGTNAEIVLGNRDRLLAASSPTGPAFEGAQISSGQRAAPGAIERVRIDPVTLEPRFKVIGSDRWSDHPGFRKVVADTGITGICGSGIIEAVAELFLAGILTSDGVIDGGLAARTPRIEPSGRTFSYVLHEGSPRILVTQDDVRAIQLAKAALYAGARLLMDHLGVDAVDEIHLAGAFGSHIDTRHAMVLGLIPDCDLAHVKSIGNAAGTGRADRPPVGRRACRGGSRRPARREDRDRRGAPLPGALRRGARDPAQVRSVNPPCRCCRAARTPVRRRGRTRGRATPAPGRPRIRQPVERHQSPARPADPTPSLPPRRPDDR